MRCNSQGGDQDFFVCMRLVFKNLRNEVSRKVSICSPKGEDGEINIQAKGIQNTVPNNENIPMKIIIQCDEEEQMKSSSQGD